MDLNISNFSAGLTEPAAKVANNLIDKVCSAVGWIVKPHWIKETKIEARQSIIMEIAERKDINPITRLAIVNNIGRIEKEYHNQVNILETSLQYLQPDAKPELMDDDWLSSFFDKAKHVSDKEMRLIWAKILAEEANNYCISKNLLHILSIMSIFDAKSFLKLVPYCASTKDNDDVYAFIYGKRENGTFTGFRKINFDELVTIEKLGLINLDPVYQYTVRLKKPNTSIIFDFYNEKVELFFENKELKIGNVLLTSEGIQLCHICEKTFDRYFYNICLKNWKDQGFRFSKIINDK